MKNLSSNIVPSLFMQTRGEDSLKIALQLTQAERKFVVRFTGGCGYMSPKDTQGLYDLFIEAFLGYEGAILFGGTRMLKRDDLSVIVPGITEVPVHVRRNCPGSKILGVVPKTQDLRLTNFGMVVADGGDDDYLTIIHPNQEMCLIVQQSVDEGVSWEAEYQECIKITQNLRAYAGFNSLLVSYNGGGVTEKEILDTAKLGWPVLLIDGSGRKSEEYTRNKKFLMRYRNVLVAQKNSESIREKLTEIGVIDERSKEWTSRIRTA